MKSNRKTKLIILIVLGIFFTFSPIITTNLSFITGNNNKSSDYNYEINLDNENLKVSKISGKIHIDNNWTATKAAGICTGNGTFSEPYIIEDLEIDAGGSGSCIFIENANDFFKIENCTLFNSGTEIGEYDAGITLQNVENGNITNNTCSNNNNNGIVIRLSSENITVSNNTCSNNNGTGIYLNNINYITVSNNTLKDNSDGIVHFWVSGTYYSNNKFFNNGIHLNSHANTTLSGNLFYNSGISFYGPKSFIASHRIDTSNLVNDKPVYYYANQQNLKSINFTDAGQIILANCNNSIITNCAISNGSRGISLFYSNYTSIMNCVFNNTMLGIYLSHSNYNNISYNNGTNGSTGIGVYHGDNNIITENYMSNNSYAGIDLYHSNNTFLTENIIAENKEIGVLIYDSDNNNISNNYILNSLNSLSSYSTGISFQVSFNNSVINNTIFNRDYFHSNGISFYESSNNSIIGNNISNHNYGIYLTSSNNSEIIGNTLLDNFKQCIYEVNCEGTIVIRNLCNTAIKINSPLSNDLFGHSPPTYNIQVKLFYQVDLLWYTLDSGLTNISFSDNGTIDQSEWDKQGSGIITLSLYANDTMGNRGFAEVNINKDITSPLINIITPTENQTYLDNAPFFNIQIIEQHVLLQKWYSLNGEVNITFTTETQIDEAEWYFLEEGTVVITFYAEDELGNVGMSSVIVIKGSQSTPGAPQAIPGYNLLFLLGILSVGAILITKKVKPKI